MTIETPIWLQDGTYPARLDRAFIERVMRGEQRVFDGLAVSEASPSANFTVDVAVGAAAVEGTDTELQGMYFVRVTAAENVAVPSTPAGTRTDSVILRVRDGQAGGGDAPADADAIIEVIEGTVVPDSSILLATIARSNGEGAILNSAITDQRPLGLYPYGVGTDGPPSVGVEGDLYVQVTA